jgi:predicted transcriptional regulator
MVSTGERLLIMADNSSTFMELTASIVSAYVRHNPVPFAELPALIGQGAYGTHARIVRARRGTTQRAQARDFNKEINCSGLHRLP